MAGLTEAAPAKVNLFLHVIGRRPDGYHLLDSLAVFPPVGDELSAELSETLSMSVEGPFAAALQDEPSNLVLRAARALADAAHVHAGARMVLRKNLPVASGIGGGSTDAAATLRILGTLWQIPHDPRFLARVAIGLGADVPVCLAACSSRMGGIGELVQPAPLIPQCGILLVNPGVAVATKDVFGRRSAPWSLPARLPLAWPNAEAMATDLTRLRNDLEPAAMAIQPAIADVLVSLSATPNCLMARMSGSGATCFALYPDVDAAKQALSLVDRPGWWCWSGPLIR